MALVLHKSTLGGPRIQWESESLFFFSLSASDLASISLRYRQQKKTSICFHHPVNLHLYSPSTRSSSPYTQVKPCKYILALLSLKSSLFSPVLSPFSPASSSFNTNLLYYLCGSQIPLQLLLNFFLSDVTTSNSWLFLLFPAWRQI